MDENKIKAKYMRYVLNRFVYPYEDYPDDKTLEYEDFRATIIGNIYEHPELLEPNPAI